MTYTTAARLTVIFPKYFADEAAVAPYVGHPEKLGNFVYASRMGNGPPKSGDGYRFRGRGYVQITGRDGYRQVGRRSALDLVGQPDGAFAPANALKVALCFWDWKIANPLCDGGDFKAVTRRVNGGLNGWPDRVAWLDKVRRVLVTMPSVASPLSVATIIAVQKALRRLGYVAIGAADGLIGGRTRAAVLDWRLGHGLGEGGIDADVLHGLDVDED